MAATLQEDYDMAEMDLDWVNSAMKDIENTNPNYEEDVEWQRLWDEANALENEMMYLQRCMDDDEDDC